MTMESREKSATPVATTPWNKSKLIGAKPPLRPKHVWSIRTKLQVEERIRDLALFNVAIDSKLRGCDVVALKVEDLAPNGYAVGYSPGLLPAALAVPTDRVTSDPPTVRTTYDRISNWRGSVSGCTGYSQLAAFARRRNCRSLAEGLSSRQCI
jgi:hypothetical protein